MSARSVLLSATAVISAALIPGCAPVEQIDLLERRVNSLALEQATLRQEVLGKKTEEGAVQSNVASIGNRIDVLQSEILRINGQLEQLAYAKEQDRARIEALEQKISGGQAPPPPPGETGPVTGTVPGAPPHAAAPPPAAAAPPAEPNYYEQGVAFFKQGQHKDSIKSFQAYLEKNPKGDLADNAYFWMGENEFKLERYEEAILDYQKLLDGFPNSNKAPDAMYKQGLAFMKLGDHVGARIVFQKLVKKYPSSSQAAQAKEQLAKLK
ncbi:MAG: tol-pal system protein YbgF [Deltaproteobacteria bacterium]